MKKGFLGRGLLPALILALVCLAWWAQPVSAAPEGGTVTAGSAAIDQAMPGVTNITQFTDRVIINWEKYGIGLQELVRYLQPNDLAVALNRVTGVDPSVIMGSIQANGRIFILNPNGILFGQQSKVDVGGLMATTLSIKDQDFMNGNYVFIQDPSKRLSFVVNKGQIKAADGGFVVLVAPLVNNEGTIIANLGHVVVGGASQATLSFDGQGLMNFAIPPAETAGNVVMTTEACADVLHQVVNNGGIVDAGEVIEQDGQVVLVHGEGIAVNSGTIQTNGAAGRDAGSVLVHSTQATVLTPTSNLEARGIGEDSNGGLIETSTYRNIVFNGEVDASAEQGHGGTWTLDPTDVTIQASAGSLDPGAAGNFIPLGLGPVDTISTGAINNFLTAGTSVNIVTTSIAGGNGDITVNSAITPGTGNIPVSLTLTAERNIAVNAAIDGSGLLNPLDVILAATGNVYVVAPVTTNGGSFSSSGVVFNNTDGAITTGNGNITLMHTGNITLGADLNAGAGTVALSTTAGGISQTGGAITGSSLGVRAVNAVDLNLDANDVATMAGQVTGAVQAFSYRDANAVTIDYVSALNGIVTNNGAITVTTVGGDLTVNNTPYPDVDAGSAQVNLTAGGAESRLTVTGSVRGTSGVTYNADDMTLTGATDAGTNDANLLQTTINRPIDLGTDATGSLGLTNDELNTVTAGVLRIGDGNSGNITISAPISPSQIPTLSLQTGGTITQPGGAVAITVTNLAVSSAGTTSLMNTSNNVTNLAGQVTGAGQAFYYEDADGLSIGTVGTMNGIHTNNAAILIGTLNGNLTVDDTPAANDVDSGTGNIGLTAGGSGCLLTVTGNVHGTGGVEYKADDMTLIGTTITGAGGASLYQSTNGRPIDLGTNTAETLGLTNAELQTITGGTLRVGSNGGGNITISAPVFSLNATTLVLGNSGGTSAISQNSGATISVANLRLSSAGPVTLNEANHVGKLAAEISGAGNAFSFTNADALNVGTVYSVNGITTNNGAVNLTTGDTLTLSHNLSAGTGTVTLNSSAGGVNQTGGSLTAANLLLTGSGSFALNQAGNNVGTIASNLNGSLNYTDADTLTIGTVGATYGILTTGGSLSLNANGITQTAGGPVVTGGGAYTAGAGNGAYTANAAVAAGAGSITITADGIDFLGGPGSVTGTGTVLLQPSTDATSIGIGSESGTLQLSTADIEALADGFYSITIGRTAGQHVIRIGAITFNDPVTVQAPVSPGHIYVDGQITGIGDASITLDGPGATTTLNADIVTAGAPIMISDSVEIGTANVLLDTTNAGGAPAGADIHITGTTDSTAGNAYSLRFNSGSNGNIALSGAVGNNNMLNVLTVTNSNSAAFESSLTANTVVLTNTTTGQSITFSAAATIGTLTTAAHGYNVVFNGGGTVTTDATFLNTGTVTLGNNAGDAVTFTGGLDTTACSGTFIGGTVNTTNADMDFGPVTLTVDTVLSTGGGSITFSNTLNGEFNLGITAGTGNITFAGAVGDIARLGAITVNSTHSMGTVNVTAASITQLAGTGTTIFNGALDTNAPAGIAVTGNNVGIEGPVHTTNGGPVTIANGGLLTIAADADMNLDGAFLQNGAGLVHTAGDITTTNDAVTYTAATTFTGNSMLAAGSGLITLAAVKIADGVTLTLGSGGAGGVTVASIAGSANGAASNVTFYVSGPVNVTGTVGTDIGTLTITNSGGTTFGGAVGSSADRIGTVVLSNTAGTIEFNDSLYATNLTDPLLGFNVAMLGAITDVTNAVTFMTTGTVTLGNGGDNLTFAGGVTHTAGPTNIGGDVNTTNADMDLGPVTLTADTVLDTGPGSGNITLSGAVTGGGFDLQLISGYGTTTANGALNAIGTLTLQENQASSTGTMTFNDNLSANSVVTFAQAYDISFLGAMTTVADAVTFANTGGVMFGNGGNTLTFTGGVTHTSGINYIYGNIATSNSPINLNNTTNAGNSTLAAGNNNITLGATTISNGSLLTLGTGGAGNVTVASIAGVGGGNSSDVTFYVSGPVNVTGTVGTDIGTLTVTYSGGTTFGGAVGSSADRIGTVVLSNTAGTIEFNDNLYATNLTDPLLGFNVAMLGAITDVTNAVTFMTTGTVTFGNGGDNLTFSGGVTHTAGPTNIGGTVNTTSTNMNFGAVTLTGDTALNTGAEIGDITFGGTLDGGFSLDLAAGTGNVVFTGVVGGCTPLVSITTDAGGSTSINGGIITTTGAQTFNAPVILGANTVLNGIGITFGNTLDGGFNLGLITGAGNINFTGVVGGITRLGALTINSANDVTADAINAASIAQIAGTGTTVFNGPLNTNDAAGIALTGNNFTINNTVTTTGGGPVTITNAGSLPIAAVGDMTLDGAFLQNGAGLVNLAGDINTTNDNITFNSAATLSGPVVFNAGMGTVILQGVTCDPHDLNIIADGIDFNGGTGSITGTGHVNLMPSADNAGIGIAGGAGTLQLTTADIQSLADGFNRITIGSATGRHVITINAITFTDPVLIRTPDGGSITVNGQITGSGNASVTLDGLGETTTLNADIVTAGNPIIINDSVLLGSPAVVTLNTADGVSVGANISISGAVNDTGTASALVLNAGAGGFVTLGGFVGDTTPIASLTTTGAINNIRCVTTSGAQAYTGAINLNGDLISEDSGAITFAGPVMLQGGGNIQTSGEAGADIHFQSTLDGAFSLYIDAGFGDILLDGAVGGITSLADLGIGSAYNVSLPAINISGELSQGSGIGPTTFNGPVVSGGEIYMFCGSVVFAGTSHIIAGGGAGNVTLSTMLGGISSGSSAVDITAGDLSLSSADNIGTGVNPLATAVQNLDAESDGAGGIYILNTGNLILCNLGGAAEAIYSNGGAVEISAASTITVNGPVATNGGNLVFTATAGITQLGAGNIDTTAETGTPAGSCTADAGSGSYTMNSGAIILTNDSDGSGNIQITAASIGIGVMNAGSSGSVNLTASSGSIQANLVTGVNVAARNLTFSAPNNIGTSLNPVLTKVENLTALANSGSLFVSEYESLNLLDVRAGIDISITCAAGNMVLTAVKAGRDVYLTALDGTITGEISKISAQNIILTMSAGGTVEPITPRPIIVSVETASSQILNSETYLRVISDISNPWQPDAPDFSTWMLLNKLISRTERVLYVTPPSKDTPSPISSL